MKRLLALLLSAALLLSLLPACRAPAFLRLLFFCSLAKYM